MRKPPTRDADEGVGSGGVQRNVVLKFASNVFDLGIGRR